MTALVTPTVRLHRSWAATVGEYAEPAQMHGSGVWGLGRFDVTEQGCRAAVTHLRAQADPATKLADDLVHCTYLWITDGDGAAEEVVGFLALRHSLTPMLLEVGGHIGYSVRPSRRREGHATRALALAVRRAGAMGLDPVLVTCDDDNLPSARTIERCGGAYEDSRGGKRRYWITTANLALD